MNERSDPGPNRQHGRPTAHTQLALLLAALFAAVFACADVAFAATTIPATTYTQSATWTAAGSPYVINGDVTVASGAALTIEPGVIVKFNHHWPSPRKLVVASGGALVADGTAGNRIDFTSIKDDAIGGDTGGDGPTSCSSSEYAYAIQVRSASPLNRIGSARFRCGGYALSHDSSGVVEVLGAAAALTATDVEIQSAMCSAFFVTGGATLTLARGEVRNSCVGVMVGANGTANVEDTTIVGTNTTGATGCGCGHGIRTEDGTVFVSRSTLRNLQFGAVVMLSSTTTAAASRFSGNTIRDNGYGVYLTSIGSSLPPLAQLPTGHLNNIYVNGGANFHGQQLAAGGPTSAGLDWSNNYWGSDAAWRVNPDVCADPGYLAYPNATPGSPSSPARTSTYAAGWPSQYCTKNWAWLGGPAGYAPVPFGSAPNLPTAATLGAPCSAWVSCATGHASDPVATASGNFVHQRVDLRLAGIGVPFRLVRTYNSLDGLGGRLGPGWTHTLAASLRIGNGGDVTARTDDGAQLPFTKNGDGSFTPAPGIRATLEAVGGGYRLTRHDQLRYEFDSTGRLLSARDRNGQGLTLAYTSGNLTSVTDSAGRMVAFAYDTSNRLGSVTLPGGRSVTYTYNASGRLATVTDARGKTWSYTYDGNGLLSKETNPVGQQVFRNVYDPVASRVVEQYDGLEHKTTFAWNAATQTATITDARGKQWRDVYAHNLLVARTNPLNQTTTFAHDASANVTSITDPRGKTLTMTYDARGNMLTRTAPAPLSYVESWTYSSRNDVTSHTNGRGKTTAYGYDANGNLTTITQPGGISTSFARNASTGLVTSVTDPRGKTTGFGYDAAHNLTSVTSTLGFATTMSYDGSGRLTGAVDPRGNLPGANPADYLTAFTYDNDDRLLSVRDPLGHTTTYVYDNVGRRTSFTDANNHATAYGYDAADRLTSVTAPGGAATAYEYDPVGNVSKRTAPGGRVTSYAYDDAGRLARATSPTNRVWSYGYDAAGNRTSVGVPSGGTIAYGYDALGRLASIDYSDATPDVTFAYDANHNRTQMTDGAGSESYGYDELDRLTGVTRGADSFGYGYDDAGNLTSRTYPGGRATAYAYDDDGRLASVTSNGQTFTYGYNAAGDVTRVDYPSTNGAVETRSYDRAGRVLEVRHAKGATTLASAAYTYDPVGNPTQISRDTGTETHAYDQRDRLTEVCYSTGCGDYIRYAYDPVGNRSSETRPAGTTTYSYNLGDELTSATGPSGTTNYAYDANGNQTQAGSRTFAYDLGNRLLSTTAAGATTSYSYDGDGKRLTATSGADTTRFLWDANNALPELVLERDGAGAALRTYVLAGEPLAFDQAGSSHYFHHDALGSVAATSSGSGSLEWRSGYEPYGSARGETLVDPTAPASPLRFTGQYRDPTGLYHLRARQYDPTTGRFHGLDPLPPSQADPYLASYHYAANQPTVLVDPSGLGAVWPNGDCDFVCLLIGDPLHDPVDALALLPWFKILRLAKLAKAAKGVPDAWIVVRGGTKDLPPPGEVFSGAAGRTLGEAASGVPHGTIRKTTAGEIRAGGGTVEHAPELTRGGNLNEKHVNICLGPGPCPFGPTEPNPVPPGGRIR